MDELDAIEAYLHALEESLRRAGRPIEPLVDEARAHLVEDAARIAHAEGCSDGEAARRAIERFGAVGEVVAASRRYGRALAASVARVASLVMLAVLAWETTTGFVDPDRWPLLELLTWLLFVAELTATTVATLRALWGRAAPRVLRVALQLNGAVAAALVVGKALADGLASQRGPFAALDAAEPLTILMIVQAVAALRALGQQATQVGQPSLPVELQPPG